MFTINELRSQIITIFVLVLLYSCSQSSEFFIGKWQIVQVVEDNTSIDLNDNWMNLKKDGTFESYDGKLNKIEQGRWRYQPENKKLFIDGKGEDGDSHWGLSVKNDTLIFKSISSNLYLVSKKMER